MLDHPSTQISIRPKLEDTLSKFTADRTSQEVHSKQINSSPDSSSSDENSAPPVKGVVSEQHVHGLAGPPNGESHHNRNHGANAGIPHAQGPLTLAVDENGDDNEDSLRGSADSEDDTLMSHQTDRVAPKALIPTLRKDRNGDSQHQHQHHHQHQHQHQHHHNHHNCHCDHSSESGPGQNGHTSNSELSNGNLNGHSGSPSSWKAPLLGPMEPMELVKPRNKTRLSSSSSSSSSGSHSSLRSSSANTLPVIPGFPVEDPGMPTGGKWESGGSSKSKLSGRGTNQTNASGQNNSDSSGVNKKSDNKSKRQTIPSISEDTRLANAVAADYQESRRNTQYDRHLNGDRNDRRAEFSNMLTDMYGHSNTRSSTLPFVSSGLPLKGNNFPALRTPSIDGFTEIAQSPKRNGLTSGGAFDREHFGEPKFRYTYPAATDGHPTAHNHIPSTNGNSSSAPHVNGLPLDSSPHLGVNHHLGSVNTPHLPSHVLPEAHMYDHHGSQGVLASVHQQPPQHHQHPRNQLIPTEVDSEQSRKSSFQQIQSFVHAQGSEQHFPLTTTAYPVLFSAPPVNTSYSMSPHIVQLPFLGQLGMSPAPVSEPQHTVPEPHHHQHSSLPPSAQTQQLQNQRIQHNNKSHSQPQQPPARMFHHTPPAQTEDRVYRCTHPGCEWSFARSSDQKRHIRSHMKPSLRCPYWELETSCNRKGGLFYRLDVLKRHLRLVHLNRPVDGSNEGGQCRVCLQVFTTTKDFIDHCAECAKNTLANR